MTTVIEAALTCAFKTEDFTTVRFPQKRRSISYLCCIDGFPLFVGWVPMFDIFSAFVAAVAGMIQPRNTSATFCWSSEWDISDATCFCFTGCERPIMIKSDHISVFRVPRGLLREIFHPLTCLCRLALSMGIWVSSMTDIQTSTHFQSKEKSGNQTYRLRKLNKVNFLTSQHVVWV